MILSEEEAKEKICILLMPENISLRTPLPRPPRIQNLANCIASQCFTYWRWANPEHTLGYCSITGKPEF